MRAEIPEGSFKKAEFNLFPTLVQVFNFEDHPSNKDIVELMENFEHTANWPKDIGKGKTSSLHFDPVSKVHKTTNCLSMPEFEKLRRDIENCLNDYTRTVGLENVELTKSWFNVQENEGHVNEHRHELSIVSGAYYPYVEEGSAPIIFKSPILLAKMAEVHDRATEFTANIMEFHPRTGMLVLFPSWLYHHTSFNKTNKRLTVSFNTRHLQVCYHEMDNPHQFK